ncbi:hypothetical protein DPM19_28685 [Actinomadura craniellae]|uniref:Uncharacterized protein n=1 Tax=Actinomadura craniellae TaxID=2231787 RepID=A0A365GXT5_9ACTN|nr:hypothetical protein [Actinomadura craniellae]RAY11612.1 hypothetical protein DPM19_28685 [Actinomadura craniellae]
MSESGLRLDDIPPLTGPRPEGADRVRRRGPAERGTLRPGRRAVLGGLVAAGGSLGLAVLGVLPPARQALAAGYSLWDGPDGLTGFYDIYWRCPSYAAGHDCSPGCGPSLVCADCCRQDGPRRGFHHSSKSGDRYRLRPGTCHGRGWDGWRWAYGRRCGRCSRSITWRCHDGWKRGRSGAYYRTICRWPVACRN